MQFLSSDWLSHHGVWAILPCFPNMVTVRVCSKLKTNWKSIVFTNKVGKNSRYFMGVFNKTVFPLALVRYIWDDYSQLGAKRPVCYLTSGIQPALVHGIIVEYSIDKTTVCLFRKMTRQLVYFVQQFLKYGILQIWRQQTSPMERENILGKKLGKFNEGRLSYEDILLWK